MKRISALIILVTFIMGSAAPVSAAITSQVKLSDLLANASKLKSMEYSANVSLDMSGSQAGEYASLLYAIDAKGKTILSKTPSSSMQADIHLSGNFPSDEFNNGMNFSADVSMESIYTKKTLYLMLKKLAIQPAEEAEFVEPIMKQLKNTWMKLDSSDLMDYADSDVLEVTSDEGVTNAVKMMEELGLLTLTRQSTQVVSNGKTLQLYYLTFNKTGALNLAIMEQEGQYGRPLTVKEKADLQAEFNNFQISMIEVWVDEVSMIPMKYLGSLTYSTKEADGTTLKITAKASMTIEKVNSVKSIKAPKKAKDFEKLLEAIYAEAYQSAYTKSDDAQIKSYASSLRVEAEMFYDMNGNSYKNLCSSNNVKSDLSDIKSIAGSSATCNVSKDGTAYAISSPLSTDHFCVDSTGYAGEKAKALSKSATSCK